MKIAVDSVIFGYFESDLSVLVIKRDRDPFKDRWTLPGVYLGEEERFTDAVRRCLRDKAGVSISWMEQLYSFDHPARDPRERIISISYYCIVRPEDMTVDSNREDVKWMSIRDCDQLAFDHHKIVQEAIDRLRNKVKYEPIVFELLPAKFPFSDVIKCYRTILDKQVTAGSDIRNFKSMFMKLGVLKKLEEKESDVPHRPARLFKYNGKKFKDGYYISI